MSQSMTPTTGSILENDDGIDSLTDHQVKDAWVRSQLMQAVIDANRVGTELDISDDDLNQVEQLLSHGDTSALIQSVMAGFPRGHPKRRLLCDTLGWETNPEYIDELFDRLTKDNMEEAERVAGAKNSLKHTLRGSGMRNMKVARQRVENHIVMNETDETD